MTLSARSGPLGGMGQAPVVPGRASWTGLLLFLILAGAAFGNAVGYVLYAGNPLVSSDAWYFIDVFLRKAMEGSATIQDYYVREVVKDEQGRITNKLVGKVYETYQDVYAGLCKL